MAYWLMKSEPDEVSIDDLQRLGRVPWFGVRNYQARNFMRDAMQLGDRVLFYHSGCALPGIAGIGQVCSPAYADATQFDPASPYFDPKATVEKPRWLNVDVAYLDRGRFVPLAELRRHPELAAMVLLQRGSRLSITPVDGDEWRFITHTLMELRHDL